MYVLHCVICTFEVWLVIRNKPPFQRASIRFYIKMYFYMLYWINHTFSSNKLLFFHDKTICIHPAPLTKFNTEMIFMVILRCNTIWLNFTFQVLSPSSWTGLVKTSNCLYHTSLSTVEKGTNSWCIWTLCTLSIQPPMARLLGGAFSTFPWTDVRLLWRQLTPW